MTKFNLDKIEALLSLVLLFGFIASIAMNTTSISRADTMAALDGMPSVGRIVNRAPAVVVK